jgi:hypothetical protein
MNESDCELQAYSSSVWIANFLRSLFKAKVTNRNSPLKLKVGMVTNRNLGRTRVGQKVTFRNLGDPSYLQSMEVLLGNLARFKRKDFNVDNFRDLLGGLFPTKRAGLVREKWRLF